MKKNSTNHYDTLFIVTAMHLMDEVAFITATRYSRQKMLTVSSDRIDFKMPIPAGIIVELIGKVSYTGNTSLKVRAVGSYLRLFVILLGICCYAG